ncbi:MAG: hypothetical protein IJB59_08530 [Oscillospiraceae bacterium]|nr:hypothetical protein [Oscillospiraceae bacterium]
MNHRLYIIEGLPCSGKSTTSAFVAELLKQQGNVFFVDEGSGNHPADYEFHALAPAGLLSDESQIVSLKDYSGEMFDRLLQHKIYDFLPWETEMPLMLEKWRQFAREAQEDMIYVFNCVLLQNPMCETMMRFGFSEEESWRYIAQIAEIIRPLNPVVIYLKNEDIAASVRKAAAERPGWLDTAIDYHVHGAYGKSIGVEGFEGYIRCLTERQEWELRILSTLPMESLVLENPQRDWQTARQTVKEYIEDEEHAEIKTL